MFAPGIAGASSNRLAVLARGSRWRATESAWTRTCHYHIDDLGRPGWVNARGHPTRPTRRAGRWTKEVVLESRRFWRNVFERLTFPLGDGAWFDGNGTRVVRPPKGISFGFGPSRPLRFWKSVAVDPDVIALRPHLHLPPARPRLVRRRRRRWRVHDHLDVFRPPPVPPAAASSCTTNASTSFRRSARRRRGPASRRSWAGPVTSPTLPGLLGGATDRVTDTLDRGHAVSSDDEGLTNAWLECALGRAISHEEHLRIAFV